MPEEKIATPTLANFKFKSLIGFIRESFIELTDHRQPSNATTYEMIDAALSAFSVFFTQSPSFLDWQSRMQKTQGRNNVNSVFGVYQIPSDNQIRNLLDDTPPEEIYPIINGLVDCLIQFDVLKDYRVPVTGHYHLVLDGTDIFSSYNLGCEQCSQATKGEKTRHYHQVVTPILIAPGQEQVISLAPEFITPQDGSDKQDCEINASKRWLARDGLRYCKLGVTFQGDDLYCHQPFCRLVIVQGADFMFVCKDSSHQTLYEFLSDLAQLPKGIQTLVRTEVRGKNVLTHTYRFAQSLPLTADKDALEVNWCEWRTTNAEGKQTYFNSWATSHTVTKENVVALCEVGRCRWKIENENNNTLKTKGYHFEHNYGHGKNNLCNTLATLIILAYLFHTILNLMDPYYQALRDALPSRRTLFEHIRALLHYMPFDSWDDLMKFMALKNDIRFNTS